MGVQKVGRYLRDSFSVHFDGAILSGQTLLIDAIGFAFWVASGGLFPKESLALFLDLGCDYAALDALVRKNVAALVRSRLSLRFFFDGPAPPKFKALVKKKRQIQRRDAWTALQGWCLDGEECPQFRRSYVLLCYIENADDSQPILPAYILSLSSKRPHRRKAKPWICAPAAANVFAPIPNDDLISQR